MSRRTLGRAGWLSYLLGLPAFVLSLGFHRLVRRVLRRLVGKRRYDPGTLRWRLLDESLAHPLALPYVMVTGPRWNTHAVIVTSGVLRVEESLSMDVEPLFASTPDWYVVLYRGWESITCLWQGPHGVRRGAGGRIAFQLQPGAYSIIARFYNVTGPLTLPEVRLDHGTVRLPPRRVEGAGAPAPSALFGKRSWFYDALHFYLFFAMRHRPFFRPEFLRQEYLPVGNPETEFLYGAYDKGCCLEISCPDEVCLNYFVYCTCYNRSSFPVYSGPVSGHPGERTPVFEEDGTYLLRLVRRRPADAGGARLAERVQVRPLRPSRLYLPAGRGTAPAAGCPNA